MNGQDYPTATNPQTGERFVYKDGRWQPLKATPPPVAPTITAPATQPQKPPRPPLIDEALQGIKESALGIPEGITSTVTGAAGWLGGKVHGLTKLIYDTWRSGGREVSWQEAQETANKTAQAISTVGGLYKPQTQMGQTIPQVAAAPFTAAAYGIKKGAEAVTKDPEKQAAIEFVGELITAALVPKLGHGAYKFLDSKITGGKLTVGDLKKVAGMTKEVPPEVKVILKDVPDDIPVPMKSTPEMPPAKSIPVEKLRGSIQSHTHTLEDVVSGKKPVGVEGRGGLDISEAKRLGLYVKEVEGVTIFSLTKEKAAPLEAYLRSGGEYGTPEFSRLLGYTEKEIGDYREYLKSITKQPPVPTPGQKPGAKAVQEVAQPEVGDVIEFQGPFGVPFRKQVEGILPGGKLRLIEIGKTTAGTKTVQDWGELQRDFPDLMVKTSQQIKDSLRINRKDIKPPVPTPGQKPGPEGPPAPIEKAIPQQAEPVSSPMPQEKIPPPEPLPTPEPVSSAPTPPTPPTVDPVAEIVSAIKSWQHKLPWQAKSYTEQRAKRFEQAKNVPAHLKGEARFRAQQRALAGPMEKMTGEVVGEKLSPGSKDALLDMVEKNPMVDLPDAMTGREGLLKILRGELPQESELIILGRVFGSDFSRAIISHWDKWSKTKYHIMEAANISRALMSSFDLSAPLRQGLFMVGRKEFYGAFKQMFKYFGSEKAYKGLFESIAKDNYYKWTQSKPGEPKFGLAMTELGAMLNKREEAFMSDFAEHMPGAEMKGIGPLIKVYNKSIGRGVHASARAYTGFLNKLRFDVFKDLMIKAEKLGLDPKKNIKLRQDIIGFVNHGTGRGGMWGFEKHTAALNSALFSPRLLFSRLNLLFPGYYIKLHPFVRKEALKSLFTTMGAGMTMIGIAKAVGVEVGDNPFSSDFGKIKIGKTRIDVWGGFQQPIRTLAQFTFGKTVSPVTGKTSKVGKGYKPTTRRDIAQRFFESKLSPGASLINVLMVGKDFTGKPISVPKEIRDRVTPMLYQDLYDIWKENPDLREFIPKSLLFGGLGMFGVGLQTYETKKKAEGLRQ